MKVYLISDPHLNHHKIETYCDRPSNFTDLIVKNWQNTVQPTDLVLCLGDVFIGPATGWKAIYPLLPGRKILVRGNHDWHHNCKWWMENGFDFACDAISFRHVWLTHKPSGHLPNGCDLNIHGHLHNIWHGFHKGEPDTAKITQAGRLRNTWQRLFAIEYTDYRPVEFEHFVNNPDRYQARGPVAAAAARYEALIDQTQKEEKRSARLAGHVCKTDKCQCKNA
jgi:calcineurin-like phosphoesterase family protein